LCVNWVKNYRRKKEHLKPNKEKKCARPMQEEDLMLPSHIQGRKAQAKRGEKRKIGVSGWGKKYAARILGLSGSLSWNRKTLAGKKRSHLGKKCLLEIRSRKPMEKNREDNKPRGIGLSRELGAKDQKNWKLNSKPLSRRVPKGVKQPRDLNKSGEEVQGRRGKGGSGTLAKVILQNEKLWVGCPPTAKRMTSHLGKRLRQYVEEVAHQQIKQKPAPGSRQKKPSEAMRCNNKVKSITRQENPTILGRPA